MQIQLDDRPQALVLSLGNHLLHTSWLTELTRRCLGLNSDGHAVVEPIADSVAWEDTEIDVRRVVL
ncbi:hypothetical protein [Roseateles sp. P5_D6]